MSKPGCQSKRITPTHSYAKSAELTFIYTQLYPGQIGGYQEFTKVTQSKSHLSIEDPAPSQQALSQEIDFPLRQFLWFIRPAPDLIAYEEFFHRWQSIYAQRHRLKVAHLLPWDSLHKTACSIKNHIAHYMSECKRQDIQPSLFPKYVMSSKSQGKRLTNPMSRHSSVDFPLYTILLERPAKTANTAKLSKAFEDLLVLTLVHEAQQRKVSEQEKHPGFKGPYEFLQQANYHGPGHALLSETRRAIKKWSDKLRFGSFERQIAPGLINDYIAFKHHCTQLYDQFDSLKQDNDYAKDFLRYFSISRQSRSSGGLGGSQGLKRKDSGQGGHYWINLDHTLTTEDIGELTSSVYKAKPTLTEIQFQEAQAAGEDPFEDIHELPQAELILLNNQDVNPPSKLILQHHTSHTQQLMATINQRIWWAQTDLTHEDMDAFFKFLEINASTDENQIQGMASNALMITILLGVNLGMALQTYWVPTITDDQWIMGKTRVPFGVESLEDHILITQAQVAAKYTSQSTQTLIDIWSYPIQTHSYLDDQKSIKSTTYAAHTSRIAFRDESGFIQSIQRRLGSTSTNTPLFPIAQHEQLREACLDLIQKFNKNLNINAKRTQEKRTISLKKIQNYYRAQLQRHQIDQVLVDTLDWDTPLSQIPSLHYYTHPLHRTIRQRTRSDYQQHDGLQYTLSEQTAQFKKTQRDSLPPTKNWSIGANQLVKIENIQKGIARLIKQTNVKIKQPGSKEYQNFIDTINAYTGYVTLWFCMETSHRPHHTPYVDISHIDLLHGIVKLKDKSSIAGEKYRLAWVSPKLRQQMTNYSQMIKHLRRYLQRFSIQIDQTLECIYLKAVDPPCKNSAYLSLKHGLLIDNLNASHFRELIQNNFGKLAPNFYRKLMVHLLLDPTHSKKISSEHIRHWLGHWTHGTAPTNEFKSTDHLGYIHEIKKPIQSIIKNLGFEVIQLKLPRLPSDRELSRAQSTSKPKTRKKS